jgi:RND family efflux transporter MFP subunit
MRKSARLIAAVWGLALVACSGESAAPSSAPASVPALEVVAVERAEVPRELTFDGVVEALNQATVSAQTAGRIVELPFDVGDYVAKDAVIVRFTGVEQRARTESADAAVAEAKARLNEAELALTRTRDMHERKLIATVQLDTAVANRDSARARLEAARAALAEARQGLDYTTIRAPYAGIVVARHVQVGETVTVGKPLMTGVSLEQLRVAVDVPQQHIGPLRKHAQARAVLADGSSLSLASLRIPPNADPNTHTFRVLADLPEGDHALFPGELIKIAFVSAAHERLLVPSSAVWRQGELSALYVQRTQGLPELRYVRVGETLVDGRVAILAGVSAGETVVREAIHAARARAGAANDP